MFEIHGMSVPGNKLSLFNYSEVKSDFHFHSKTLLKTIKIMCYLLKWNRCWSQDNSDSCECFGTHLHGVCLLVIDLLFFDWLLQVSITLISCPVGHLVARGWQPCLEMSLKGLPCVSSSLVCCCSVLISFLIWGFLITKAPVILSSYGKDLFIIYTKCFTTF